MSIAYGPLDRIAKSGPGEAPHERLMWLQAPLILTGVGLLLLGSAGLIWLGLGLVVAGALLQGRSLPGWLDEQGSTGVGWLVFVSGSLLGFVASPYPAAAGARLGAIFGAAALFLWLADWVRSPARLRWAAWALVGVCAFGSLVVLALIRGQLPDSVLTRRLAPALGMFSVFPGVSGDVLDVNSRFPVHQYGLAYLMLVMIAFLTAELVLGERRLARGLAAAASVCLVVLLAATEARGALLAAAASVALIGSTRSRWFWLALPSGAIALYSLLAIGWISRSIETEWLNTRLSIWSRSLGLLSDYPLTGAGLGMQSFAEVFAWTFGLPNAYQVVHSHNILIQAYAEQGILGLIGLIFVLGSSLLYAWRAARTSSPRVKAMAAGLLGALVASILYGLTDQVPTTNGGLAVLAALCALALAGSRLVPGVSEQPAESLAGTQPARAPLASPESTREKSASALRLIAQHWMPIVAGGAALMLMLGVAPRWASGLALNNGAVQLAGAALDRSLSLPAKTERLQRAEYWLVAAVSSNPKNPAAYRELARTRLLQHDVPGAVEALDAGSSRAALNDHERVQMGRVYLEAGFWEQAFALWQSAGQSELLTQTAEALERERNYKAAAAAHAALVELNPTSPEHLSNLAKALLAADGTTSVDEAMRWFDKATELNPEARRSLSRQLVLQGEPYRINERRGGGRLDLALFWFGLAARVDPTYDRPSVELGSLLYYAGRYPEAAEHFRVATKLDSRNGSSWHQLGQAEQSAGRLEQAIAAYSEAVKVAPSRSVLHTSLGRAYVQAGQCDSGRTSFERALALEPGHAQAQSELASLSACRPS